VSDLKLGDKILILEEQYNCAGVKCGDVLEVSSVYPDCLRAGGWWIELEDEGTGWERYDD
jgi:hypothetical protein